MPIPRAMADLFGDEAAFRPYRGEFGRRADVFTALARRGIESEEGGGLRGFQPGMIRGSDLAARVGGQSDRTRALLAILGQMLVGKGAESREARAKFMGQRDAARYALADSFGSLAQQMGAASTTPIMPLLDTPFPTAGGEDLTVLQQLQRRRLAREREAEMAEHLARVGGGG